MVYKVYCRECGWTIPDHVHLKGEANWLAGRHISDTGHSVAIREADAATPAEDNIEFYRSEQPKTPVDILHPLANPPPRLHQFEDSDPQVKRCGPVFCRVETVQPVPH